MATINQHSIMLDEINRSISAAITNQLSVPENLTENFPINNIEEFQAFEKHLTQEPAIWDYMVKRLAALGGTGVENLTRRIMMYLMSNEVAQQYNWKGRDKLAFEKSKVMELILAAVFSKYNAEDINELRIETAVKDWLKYAKSRIQKMHKRQISAKNMIALQ